MELPQLGLLFKALSDASRLRVVAALLHFDELCACHIVELLGVSGATVSAHMSVLIQSGLVTSCKRGRWIHYRLDRQHSKIEDLIKWMSASFELSQQVDEDRATLSSYICCNRKEVSNG